MCSCRFSAIEKQGINPVILFLHLHKYKLMRVSMIEYHSYRLVAPAEAHCTTRICFLLLLAHLAFSAAKINFRTKTSYPCCEMALVYVRKFFVSALIPQQSHENLNRICRLVLSTVRGLRAQRGAKLFLLFHLAAHVSLALLAATLVFAASLGPYRSEPSETWTRKNRCELPFLQRPSCPKWMA